MIPSTPITITALAVALITVAILAVLVYAAPHVETLVTQALAANEPLAPKAGTIAKSLVFVATVLVAYHGFAGVVVPFLEPTDTVWMYDIAFLALALIPTAVIAIALYRALDPAAEQLTQSFTPIETIEDSEETATSEESDDVTETESMESVDAEGTDTTNDTENTTDEDPETSR
ncbi:hypothetical protein [Halospeciosus flavus]|uniref:Uncharacterized protein n=1 Tax=Halospeciosus flavus TaxID=3032283 RepID=A0ABD5Z3A9_9EURY|nr:hypothetical protein [Halospeciosus flavus]